MACNILKELAVCIFSEVSDREPSPASDPTIRKTRSSYRPTVNYYKHFIEDWTFSMALYSECGVLVSAKCQ
jgi:hypothetical protein